ncbi:hypothetical protein [Arvimicrobium flavum]|uniref:hypothetical protein n=1 Tax=Arvimicrobium flavum TaxID=3393320 RepID=UPI00237AA4EB|nr:hypothetical protein [Mesorhizobium shangrilense]
MSFSAFVLSGHMEASPGNSIVKSRARGGGESLYAKEPRHVASRIGHVEKVGIFDHCRKRVLFGELTENSRSASSDLA